MAEKPKSLVEFAEQVANEMEEEWKVDTEKEYQYHRVVLEGPRDGVISIVVDRGWENSNRVRIFGGYPTYEGVTVLSSHDTKFPEIGVAISRGAAVIAREIQRRFLPKYWPLVERASKLVERYTTDNEIVLYNAEYIEQVSGGCIRPHSVEGAIICKTPIVQFDSGDIRGKVQVQRHTVNLDIKYCPIGLALQLLEIVSNYTKPVTFE